MQEIPIVTVKPIETVGGRRIPVGTHGAILEEWPEFDLISAVFDDDGRENRVGLSSFHNEYAHIERR